MAAMDSPDGPFSPHGHAVLDKLILLQASESSAYRVPRSFSMSIASDQCCNCPVLSSDNEGTTVELNAFVPSENLGCVRLHCEGVPVQQFTFRDDMLLGIKLLPLPGSKKETVGYAPVKKETAVYTQVVGVILILASLRKGLSIFSIVLDKQEGSSSFRQVECREFRPRTCVNDKIWHGRRIRSLVATVVNTNEESTRPFLLVAASSSLEGPGQTPADQTLDIQRYTLRNHKCPIFDYTNNPLEEIPLSHSAVALEDVGRVIDMTFGTISASGFISLAVMTCTQLTVVQVALSPLSLLHSAKLLLTGCHPTHRVGIASKVVCLGAQDGDVDMESFAVVCKPKSSDFVYTPAVQTRKTIGNRGDAFTPEESVISINANAYFSPKLMDRKKVSGRGLDILMEDTVSSAIKDFCISHTDEAEQGALVVVTPEKEIVDVTDERIGDTTEVVDTSLSMLSPRRLSPLMGLTVANSKGTRDESTLMNTLFSIHNKTPMRGRLSSPGDMGLTLANSRGTSDESTLMSSLSSIHTNTPILGRLSSSGDIYPDHTFHLIIARVEHVGGNGESKIKVAPVAMHFPFEMARLEVVSLRPFVYFPDESMSSPTTRGVASFEALMTSPSPMFSPSPGKMMSIVPEKVASEGPRFSIVCKAANSQELFNFVVSVSESNKICVESQTRIDLYRLLPASLAIPIKSLSVKGTAIDEASIAMKAGRRVCSSIIRLVLSLDATVAKDSDGLASASKPINLSLEEDGTVFILELSCDQVRPPQIQDSQHHTGAVESSLGLILEKLTSFEKEVFRRMDIMEKTIKENSDRVGALEAALVKDLKKS